MNKRAGAVLVLSALLSLTGCVAEPEAKTTPTSTPRATNTATPTPTPTPTPTYQASEDPMSEWLVVNKQRPLNPSNFEPADMAVPSVITNTYSRPLRAAAAAALDRLAADASAAGIWLTVASAYRSYDTQVATYNGFVARDGQAVADTYSARPGYSEHQTGLAVDLDDGQGCLVSTCFADLPAGQWLAANAWQYGFILRYPNGGQPITGYMFEPWHYRYVGIEVATAMHNSGITTLEEFFGLPAAPSY